MARLLYQSWILFIFVVIRCSGFFHGTQLWQIFKYNSNKKLLQDRPLQFTSLASKGFGFGSSKSDKKENEWREIYAPFPSRHPKGNIDELNCACGSGLAYGTCCYPRHAGTELAPTPEALLRSRYTAYFHGFPKYIFDTTHPSSAPLKRKRDKAYLKLLEIACSESDLKALEILEHESGENENEHFITFRVKRMIWMSERSKFIKESGKWLFFDEEV